MKGHLPPTPRTLGAGPGRWPSRPPLRVWAWTAGTAALVVVAALLWRGSDAAATESTTAAPAGVPDGTPADAVSEAWTERSTPLPEGVVESGRVILGSAHGVRALDPGTGEEAWHYTRANARLCDVAAVNGVVVAVFRTAHRCDEAVALHAGTGVRAWTRNVGFREDATLDSTDRIVLASSPTGVVTLDPTGNNIRWRYAPPEGCRIQGTEVGSAGVALLQVCDESPTVQFKLLDGFDGDVHWDRDITAPEDGEVRLLGADQLLGLAVGDEVQAVSVKDGAVLQTLQLTGDGSPAMLSIEGTALLWIDGTLHALDPASGASRWEAPAGGLPSAPVGKGSSDALLVPEEGGFAHRDPVSGDRLGTSAVSDVPGGGTASGVGPVVVYRLPDRVLAYR
jgi:outer membrane protein assembly factor BamB